MASFATALQAERDLLAKSNQANLASAFLAVELRIKEARQFVKRLEALREEIELAGDDPEHLADLEASSVRKLYDRARKPEDI